MLNNRDILITGGTGSFGKRMVKTILERYKPNRLIVFSRDELKQFEMAQHFSEQEHPCMRYFIGDVRDQQRLYEAFTHVDVVIHAAALKQVPVAEYNPFEAILTNVIGAQNVIRAAIHHKVKKVVALSTDKAVGPVNLYGATKLCSDKLFIASQAMRGNEEILISVVRYGNVVGSRGSVVPFFCKMKKTGVIPITDERMTRFSISLQDGVALVMKTLDIMRGGEIFVPKIPSYHILDVAKAIAPDARIDNVGIRPGEKLHEMMIPADDSRHTIEFDDYYMILPSTTSMEEKETIMGERGGKLCEDGFSYASDTNNDWLTVEQLREIVEKETSLPEY